MMLPAATPLDRLSDRGRVLSDQSSRACCTVKASRIAHPVTTVAIIVVLSILAMSLPPCAPDDTMDASAAATEHNCTI